MWYLDFLTAIQEGWQNLLSASWAGLNQGDRAPRPAIFDMMDALSRTAEVARKYNGDPLNGLLNYSEHPGRIENYRFINQLDKLNIDCDDVQVYCYWLLYGRPWIEWMRMVNVYDSSLPNFTHAVLELKVLNGPKMIVDTNIIYPDGGYRGPYIGPESPTQYCQRMYGHLGARYFYERAVSYPFGVIV